MQQLWEFLDNAPKISVAARAAMETDLTLKELSNTIKSKAMKDTAPGPDGIPYSVHNKLWEQAGPLIPGTPVFSHYTTARRW